MALQAQHSDDISYEFNTVGFYNALIDQLQDNQDILHKIHSIASKRLQIKRDEHQQILSTRSQLMAPKGISSITFNKKSHAKSEVMRISPNELTDEEEEDLIELDDEEVYLQNTMTEQEIQSTKEQTVEPPSNHDVAFKKSKQNQDESKKRNINALDSFINRESTEPASEVLPPATERTNAPKVPSAQQTFMSQSTGDDIVDSLLMKMSAHMTI